MHDDDGEGAMPWTFWALFVALCVLLAVAGGVVWDLVQVLFCA
jgi:hypothetical protein